MAYTIFQSPRLLNSVGEKTEIACGVIDGSGTTTTVTVPQLTRVVGAISCDSADGACWVSTMAGTSNQFTVTHASGADFSWIAWGIARI